MKAIDPKDRLNPQMQVGARAKPRPHMPRSGSGMRRTGAAALTARARHAAGAPHCAQVVSSMPELCVVPRSTSAQGFLVIASDGVWSCCKSDEAYAIVARQLNADGNPQRAADQLLAHVVMECHTSDNVFITVVLIAPFEPELTAARGTPSAPPPMPRTARPLSGAHTPPTNSPLVPARASLADASADVCGRGGARSARAAPPPTAIATFALVGES